MAKIDEKDEYAELWEEARIEAEAETADADVETDDEVDTDETEGETPEPEQEADGETEPGEEKPEPEAKPDEDKERKHKERAEKRINQLTAARRAAEERAAAVEKQLIDERQRYDEERKQYQSKLAEVEKQGAENQLKTLQQERRALRVKKSELTAADDYEELATVEDQIDDINMQISSLQSRPHQPAAADPAPRQDQPPAQPQYQQPAQQRTDIPEAQQDWLREHTWYSAPKSLQEKKARAKADEIYIEMVQQYGYDADDPDTYTELTEELKRKGFADIGRKPMTKPLVDKSGLSSGATRQPSPQGANNNRQKLSNFDLQLMRQIGLDPSRADDRKKYIDADKGIH